MCATIFILSCKYVVGLCTCIEEHVHMTSHSQEIGDHYRDREMFMFTGILYYHYHHMSIIVFIVLSCESVELRSRAICACVEKTRNSFRYHQRARCIDRRLPATRRPQPSRQRTLPGAHARGRTRNGCMRGSIHMHSTSSMSRSRSFGTFARRRRQSCSSSIRVHLLRDGR